MFFLGLSCFFHDPADVGNLTSGSSAFSKTSFNIWKFMVHVLLKPGLENFEHYFTSMWDECNYVLVRACFGIAFLWDWNKNWPFPVLWPLLRFPICWHIEGSTFTASSFRIWNSSTGIPSLQLAFFIVMLSKAHLTLHSRMSGSRWVITPSWLSGSWRSFFVYFFCVFLPLLLDIFCFCEVCTISVLYCAHLCINVPLISLVFLKRTLVFPTLLFSSISLDCSLRKAFLSPLAILWNSYIANTLLNNFRVCSRYNGIYIPHNSIIQGIRFGRWSAWRTMARGSQHCTGSGNQSSPQEREVQEGKGCLSRP